MAQKQRFVQYRVGKDYVFAPGGFGLDWDELSAMYDDPNCHLVVLDGKQIAVILSLFKFLKLQWIWGFGKRSTWDAATRDKWDAVQNFVAEMEVCLMSACDLQEFIDAQKEQTKAIRELTAVVGSLDLDVTQPVPDNPDYSGSLDGLANQFRTHNLIAADNGLADLFAKAFFGRYVDPIPNPLEGDGFTQILDEQIQELSDRFVQTDLQFPGGLTKNMAETMETLLRRDRITDLEFLFTPNIVSVLEDIFYAKPQRLEDEAKNPLPQLEEDGIIGGLKTWAKQEIAKLTMPHPILEAFQDWIVDKLDTNKTLSISEILLLLSSAGGQGGMSNIAQAIKQLQMQVNLNNYNGCCDEEDCTCDGEEQTITVEGCEDIPVNGNGAG